MNFYYLASLQFKAEKVPILENEKGKLQEKTKHLLEASDSLKDELLNYKSQIDSLKKENEELKDNVGSSFMNPSPQGNLKRAKTKSFQNAFRGSMNLESTLSSEDILNAENTLDSGAESSLLSEYILVFL